jgi:hypothetical protein
MQLNNIYIKSLKFFFSFSAFQNNKEEPDEDQEGHASVEEDGSKQDNSVPSLVSESEAADKEDRKSETEEEREEENEVYYLTGSLNFS